MSQQHSRPQSPHSHPDDATSTPSEAQRAGGFGATRGRWPATGSGRSGAAREGAPSDWLTGGLLFAGVLMLVNGVLAILLGISALAKDDVYTRVGDYVFKANLTAWGWILLVLGVLAVGVGYGILQGAWWARITGIFLASLSMVAHFLFLPYTPVWSAVMVAVDFFVILALALAPDPSDPAGAQGTGDTSATR